MLNSLAQFRVRLAAIGAAALLLAPAICIASPPSLEDRDARVNSLPYPADDDRLIELAIRTLYTRVETLSAASGSPLRFAIDDFRHYKTTDLSSLFWEDLVSSDLPRTIDLSRHKRLNSRSGSRTVSYAARWQPVSKDLRAKLAAFGATIASQALGLMAQDGLEVDSLSDVTSFAVTATLNDASITYRAAFLWKFPPGERTWTGFGLFAVDPAIAAVSRVAYETLQTREFLADPGDRTIKPAVAGRCFASTVEQTANEPFSNNLRHISPYKHSGLLTGKIRCSCNTDCLSSVEVWPWDTKCVDSGGTTGGFHVPGSDVESVNAYQYDGSNSGASGSLGYICAMKQCAAPNCLFVADVSFVNGRVTYNSNDAFWSYKKTINIACPVCELDPSYSSGGGSGGGGGVPPPETQDPTPGGSAGGGWGICIMTCTQGSWNGILTMTCTVRCL